MIDEELVMAVDDSALLQANATVVAGILIFLTLAPFSKNGHTCVATLTWDDV
jgi:hypothetical protein